MARKKQESFQPLSDLLGGKKEPEKPKGKSGVKHKSTLIEHLKDGSHVVTHTPRETGAEEVKYSRPDLKGVHDGLDENLGESGKAATVTSGPLLRSSVSS